MLGTRDQGENIVEKMEGRPRITSQLTDGRTVEKSRYKMRARVKITCLLYVIVVSGIVISFAFSSVSIVRRRS